MRAREEEEGHIQQQQQKSGSTINLRRVQNGKQKISAQSTCRKKGQKTVIGLTSYMS